MSSQTKTIVIVLAIVVILGVVYITFFNTNDDSSAVSGNGVTASAAEVTFLNLAAKINPIVFDTSILSDPRFTSLMDIHTAIIPETTGRDNPFLPLAGSAEASQ